MPLNNKQRIVLSLIIIIIFQFAFFYAPALADTAVKQAQNKETIELVNIGSFNKETKIDKEAAKIVVNTTTNKAKAEVVVKTSTHIITAYNSEARQTDNSPCITANGFDVCRHDKEDTIAANFLKFGTKIRIPALFGNRIFVVRDRMNKRHSDRVDVWMKNRHDAVKFGVKIAKIEIVK